jgi:hypothetical protein
MKLLPLVLILLLGLFASPVHAAQKIMTMDIPDNPPPPFPTVLRKVVVFIQAVCDTGDGKSLTDSGTGFVVSYSPDNKRTFDYLVTNRHVAECSDGNPLHSKPIKSITIKMNLSDNTAKEQQTNGNFHWYFSNDDSVDLAATPWKVDSGAELLSVPLDISATRDFLNANYVGEGSKIIFAGFFYQLPNTHRLQPVIREGILSMMPDEPIQTTTGKPGMLYLGDIHSFGGNSG